MKLFTNKKTKTTLFVALAVALAFTFTSCRGHHGRAGISGGDGVDGVDGSNGTNGTDGLDGSDGLNGIGFDYVRGITGAELCKSFLVIPANLVLPSGILNLAPPVNWKDLQGSTLTFGTIDLSFRYYLAPMMAGEFCVVERGEDREGWESLGQIVMSETGLLAIVPLGTLQTMALDHGVIDQGIIVTLGSAEDYDDEDDESDGCVTLKYGRHFFRFGRNIRINFNRD